MGAIGWWLPEDLSRNVSSPLRSLGVQLEEYLRQPLGKGGRRAEGQAARPGPAAPIQGVGTILALGAVVPAKLRRCKFQGWEPGFKSKQRLCCEYCWEKGLHLQDQLLGPAWPRDLPASLLLVS